MLVYGNPYLTDGSPGQHVREPRLGLADKMPGPLPDVEVSGFRVCATCLG